MESAEAKVKLKDWPDEDVITSLRLAAAIWFKNTDLLLLEELIKRYRRAQPSQPPVE